VEGLNVGGYLLGYLAVLVFAGTSLVALGLLIFGLTKPGRMVFASGLLAADIIAAVATLSFLAREFNPDGTDSPVIALSALSLLLAGTGQFIAAIRNPRAYPAALACAAVALMFVAAPLLRGDVRNLIPGLYLLSLAWLGFPPAVPGLLLALASLLVATLLPVRSRGRNRKRAAGA
jgi:hypothetical protein